MKKLNFTLAILSLSLLVFSCGSDDGDSVSFEEQLAIDIETIDQYLADNDIDAQVHASGIRYVVEEPGNSESPVVGDDIAVKYSGFYLNGQVAGRDTIGVTLALDPNNVITAWLEIMPEIGEGGKMRFYSPSGYCFGKQGNGVIPPNTNLIFDVELLAVIGSAEEQFVVDTTIISEFLSENQIEHEIHSSGIRYEIIQEGTGASPSVGDEVIVNYEGAFLNGIIFDSNSTGLETSILNLIDAWKVMLPTMKEGGIIKVYAPSEYCYGPTGNQSIPPNTILTFEIELLVVK